MVTVTCPHCGATNRLDETKRDVRPVCGRCKTPLDAGAAPHPSDDGHPREFTDATFDAELRAAGDRPVLVDAWATWCPPCKMIAPTIDALAGESRGRWVVAKLDVDANPATAQRYRIGSIPTLLVFKGGQLVEQMVGVQPKHAIVATLERHAGA
jgi:thioredoxin